MLERLKANIQPLMGQCWRVVEAQHIAATRSITRSADEQQRLEELLDQVKPPITSDCQGFSYMLTTAFRYPPLPYGSRFGSSTERGIFYGSKELETAFAESAVYLWLFQSGPLTTGALSSLHIHRTALAVSIANHKAVDMGNHTFEDIRHHITSPSSWQFTQQLGENCRQLALGFIWYPSARLKGGTNAAVFTPESLVSKTPRQQNAWQVILTEDSCWFGRAGESPIEFNKTQFTDGEQRIPHPVL